MYNIGIESKHKIEAGAYMPKDRPEDKRVKIPALVHFTRLGYGYMSIKNKTRGIDYDKDCNIFYDLFIKSLNRINGGSFTLSEAQYIISKILGALNADDLGRAFYNLLKNGVDSVQLIDFNNIENNDFTVVTELPYEDDFDDSFRPDITILINGMPLSFMETKRRNNKEGIIAEYDRMTSRFSNDANKRYVNITQFMTFTNNNEYDDTETKPVEGSFYAASAYGKLSFSKFREREPNFLYDHLQEINEATENFILNDNNLLTLKNTDEYSTCTEPDTPANRIITSLYSKERILFLLQYGICYKEDVSDNGTVQIEKHVMRYPQIFATKKLAAKLDDGLRKGVLWHTQGSGKTEFAFYNVRYLTDYYAKRSTTAIFYFIVDRLELANQSKSEFEKRGLAVNLISDKKGFEEAIKQTSNTNADGYLAINVINIQKFQEIKRVAIPDYDISVQRVFFLDEAHRSYNPNGSFLKCLFEADKKSIKIAMTGTPLLNRHFNISGSRVDFDTKKIFGEYIDTYYYNDSIADGYTLRLMREPIETTYCEKMKSVVEKLKEEIPSGALKMKDIFANPHFVKDMTAYIVKDFKEFRLQGGDYETTGAMIVCASSEQAREVSRQLDEYKELSHSLILYDEGSKQDRKEVADDFKKGKGDILVVYNMLLTGYDAHRLKKLYLAREIGDHNLLQALTRVNRPYNAMRYGYVVDFADIQSEFEKTNQDYLKELQGELGEETAATFSNIFMSEEEIRTSLTKAKDILFDFDTDNIELFSRQISDISDRSQLYELRTALESIKLFASLIKLYGYTELENKIETLQYSKLLNEVQQRISLLNFKNALEYSEDVQAMINLEMTNLRFNFRKLTPEELIISDEFHKKMYEAQREIFKNCIDLNDPKYMPFIDRFKEIFKGKNIEELTAEQMRKISEMLETLRQEAKDHNDADKRLLAKFGGDEKYLRAFKRITEAGIEFNSKTELVDMLNDIKIAADSMITKASGVIYNQAYFANQLGTFVSQEYTKRYGFRAATISGKSTIDTINSVKTIIAGEYF